MCTCSCNGYLCILDTATTAIFVSAAVRGGHVSRNDWNPPLNPSLELCVEGVYGVLKLTHASVFLAPRDAEKRQIAGRLQARLWWRLAVAHGAQYCKNQ